MNQKERMLNGLPYKAWLDGLEADREACKAMIYEFNLLKPEERKRIPEILKKLFGKTGENIWIEPPFHCDYGWNIEVGENFLTAETLDKIVLALNTNYEELFAVGHLKSNEELLKEIKTYINFLSKDSQKLETVYKFLKSLTID